MSKARIAAVMTIKRRRRLLIIAAWLSVAAAPIRSLAGDEPIPPPVNPQHSSASPTITTLPMVPSRDARDTDGEWAPEREKNSLPTFIETLKGNDAAIEVALGQGRLLTTKHPVQTSNGTRFIAVGDPNIVDFEVLPNPQMIRIIGKQPGTTDLSITTADNQTYSFEIHVVYNLDLLRAQIRALYPDADVHLAQIGKNIVAEGEARSIDQVANIVRVLQAHIDSTKGGQGSYSRQVAVASLPNANATDTAAPLPPPANGMMAPFAPGGLPSSGAASISSTITEPGQVINLLRVPGPNQVMLKVRIAELNRTALREIGCDILGVDPSTGMLLGTSLAGNTIQQLSELGSPAGLTATAKSAVGTTTTAFGVFPGADFEVLLRALRRNSVLNILAEPNLVAMSGHRASFLAGGQFPVPVPQGIGGTTNTITIEFKNFGVQLDFVPTVLDRENVRLSVYPEVSTIDFSLGTVLVQGGTPVPGLNTRKTSTTVELGQGQTLAIAGLLQLELDAKTDRIPGLGDLAYIGPFFSNTSHKRVEKELLVLVTPFLVEPMQPGTPICLPGESIMDPTDHEFYFKNRIEGRNGACFRATDAWDHNSVRDQIRYESRHVCGPCGYSQ
jgi:pilus assembly protein CpaC